MSKMKFIGASCLLAFTIQQAGADSFWSKVLTSGATTGSSYLTSSDHKIVIAIQDDASSYVASEGEIRGPYLESAINNVRAEHPSPTMSDMEIAQAILARNAIFSGQPKSEDQLSECMARASSARHRCN